LEFFYHESLPPVVSRRVFLSGEAYMIGGIMNKGLRIDLGSRTFEYMSLRPELYQRFLGGKGLGLAMMVEMGLVRQDPYDPENPLLFVTGPLTGSLVNTSARSVLVTKSPLTGSFLDSNIGGHWGPQLKRAGLDFLLITGKSATPVFLHITPGGVAFEEAASLWGLGKFETETALKSRYAGSRVACIGPAGENLVRFACIGTEFHRQFGRGGSGAVMGSKKLKAVVVQGKETLKYHDPPLVKALSSQLAKDVTVHPNRLLRKEKGTVMWVRWGQELGHFLPVRNCRDVQFEDYEAITSESMKQVLNWKSAGCYNCAILCAKKARWDGCSLEGPEYETIGWLGSNCGIGDPKAIAEANLLADDLGMDTISLGATVAFAMEAYERGILDGAGTGGLDLNFGNTDAWLEMIRRIASRKGLGDLLADGVQRASQLLGKGSGDFALHIGGMEISGVNIKGSASMGLGLATADFASHTRVWSATAEMNGELTFENTPAYIKQCQDEVNTRDSLVICDFLPFGNDRLAELYTAITGLSVTPEVLERAGERISNLARLFNIKTGRVRADDTLPPRFFDEPHEAGLFAGEKLSPGTFGRWLDMYYHARGWGEDGVPGSAILATLDIDSFV
jgi:aldehyde:ferredoxin oxidoreductase